MDVDEQARSIDGARIFKLPSELIYHILSYLDAQHLASLRRTSRDFRRYAEQDQLWLQLLRPNLPAHDFPETPSPALSYCDLYLSHHPYWFLPRSRIWFSDDAYNGKLIVVKFNPATGSMTGYRLAAERPPAIPLSWTIKPSVIIHLTDPRVYISTDNPVLSLTYPPSRDLLPKDDKDNGQWTPASEVRMRVGRPEQKINASLMLSKDLPAETAATPSVSVWPPRTIPDMPRTRSSANSNSSNNFSHKGHKPTTLDEISQTTFRLRTWSHFTQGMLSLGVRIGEEVSTWSTLAPELYTSTPQKPYQGIFVGDYASHGCEFLLVLHSDHAPPRGRGNSENTTTDDAPLPARSATYMYSVIAALREQQFIDEEDLDTMRNIVDEDERAKTAQEHSTTNGALGQNVVPNVADPDGLIHRGALEAIKITGDVNVPRGEHTFVADDLGRGGFIRVAHEEPFRGARVVRSRGHVAARGFRNDEFIPSQLFLISPDLLAQYWLPFGHISFYRRVDLDELMRSDISPRRQSE